MVYRLSYPSGPNPDQGAYGTSAVSSTLITEIAKATLLKHVFEEGYAKDHRIMDLCVATLERNIIMATGGFND
jgi:hypothetical protein